MMTESQARIIKNAFEYGITTQFECSEKQFILHGYDKDKKSGRLTVKDVFYQGDSLHYEIASVRIEDRKLVLYLPGEYLSWSFFFEVGL